MSDLPAVDSLRQLYDTLPAVGSTPPRSAAAAAPPASTGNAIDDLNALYESLPSKGPRGNLAEVGVSATRGLITGVGSAISGGPALVGAPEGAVGRLGQRISEYGQSFAPSPGAGFLTRDLPESLAGFAPGALAALGATAATGPIGGALTGATLFGLQGAGGAGEAARAKGATPGQQQLAAGGGAAVGAALGLIPGGTLTRLLRIPAADLPGVLGYAVRTGAAAGEGAGIGALAHGVDNAIAQYTYDPDRTLTEGMAYAAILTGATAGAFHGFVGEALRAHQLRARQRIEQPPPPPPPPTEGQRLLPPPAIPMGGPSGPSEPPGPLLLPPPRGMQRGTIEAGEPGGIEYRGPSPSAAAALVARYESGNRPLIGWGETDLSGYPLSDTGFPMWPGKPGPKGNSTAAGLYGITRSTWDPIARQLGIHDFSPESQRAVFDELFRTRGWDPWAPHNPKLAAALARGEVAGDFPALPAPQLRLPRPETTYGEDFLMSDTKPTEPQRLLPKPSTIYGEGFTAGAAQTGSALDRALYAVAQMQSGDPVTSRFLSGFVPQSQVAILRNRLVNRGLVTAEGGRYKRSATVNLPDAFTPRVPLPAGNILVIGGRNPDGRLENGLARTLPDGTRQRLVEDTNGRRFWGDYRETISPTGERGTEGADSNATPVRFASSAEARAWAATPRAEPPAIGRATATPPAAEQVPPAGVPEAQAPRPAALPEPGAPLPPGVIRRPAPAAEPAAEAPVAEPAGVPRETPPSPPAVGEGARAISPAIDRDQQIADQILRQAQEQRAQREATRDENGWLPQAPRVNTAAEPAADATTPIAEPTAVPRETLEAVEPTLPPTDLGPPALPPREPRVNVAAPTTAALEASLSRADVARNQPRLSREQATAAEGARAEMTRRFDDALTQVEGENRLSEWQAAGRAEPRAQKISPADWLKKNPRPDVGTIEVRVPHARGGETVLTLPRDERIIREVGQRYGALPARTLYSRRMPDRLKALVEQVSGLRGVLKYLAPDEQAKLIKKSTATRFLEILDTLPDASEMASVAFSGRAKRGWYKKSAQALRDIFGVADSRRFAALLGATSPQTSVKENAINALRIWTRWDAEGRPTDRDSIIRVMGESVSGNKGIGSALPAWIPNTVLALSHPDPGSVPISGPKVNSFALNLRDFVNEVTNDAWIANYAGVSQGIFAKSGASPGKGPGYMAMSATVRKAAEILSRRTGETWTPAEVQETVWSWAKTLYEKAGVGRSARAILKAGELTHEDIADNADFASLFAGGVYRRILNEGGYDVENLLARNEAGGRGTAGGDALVGSAAAAEGGGVAPAAFQRHLEQAAGRLDRLRADRAAAAAAGVEEAGPREARGRVGASSDIAPPEPIDRTALRDELYRIVKERAPTLRLKTFEDLVGQIEGRPSPIWGQYRQEYQFKGPVEHIVDLAFGGDPKGVLTHELVHFFRGANLLTRQEWAILSKKAEDAGWLDRFQIHERYPEVSRGIKTEEAIAEAYAAWDKGDLKLPPGLRKIFSGIKTFFERVGNFLRGRGYQNADDVFGRMTSGEIGRRALEPEPTSIVSGEPRYARPPRTPEEQRVDAGLRQIRVAPDDRPLWQRATDMAKWTAAWLRKEGRYLGIDEYDPVGMMEKASNRGKLLDASISAFTAAHMSREAPTVMARNAGIPLGNGEFAGGAPMMRNGAIVINPDSEPILAFVNPLKKAGKVDAWQLWGAVNRGKGLMAEGRENLITPELIREHRNDHLRPENLGPNGENLFMDTLRRWNKHNGQVLDFGEQTHVVDPEARRLFERGEYIPFLRRIGADETVLAPGKGSRGIANQTSPIRRLRGGTEKLNDLIENMYLVEEAIIARGMKNDAFRRARDLAVDMGIFERVNPFLPRERLQSPRVQALLKRMGIEDPDLMTSAEEAAVRELIGVELKLPKDVVSGLENGKPQYWRVNDPLLYKSIVAFGPVQTNAIIDALGLPKRVLTEAVTHEPGYIGFNLFRDTLHTAVIVPDLKPGWDTAKGAFSALRSDPAAMSILAGGGWYGRAGAAGFMREVNGNDWTPLNSPRKVWEALDRFGSVSEQANRIAVAEGAKRAGKGEAQAQWEAKNVMNYTASGGSAIIKALIATVPFLNARIQGLDRLYQGAKDNPASFMIRGGLIAGAGMALWAMNKDNPDYQRLTDYEKQAYWHLFLPGFQLRIPKPFEVGAVFGSIPEMLGDFINDPNYHQLWDAFTTLLAQQLQMTAIPQAVQPAYDVAKNTRWSGGPIVNESEKSRIPGERFGPNTSTTMTAIGQQLGYSPDQLEYLFKGYGGTLGAYFLAATDALTNLGSDKARPSPRIEDYPVIGRLIRTDPAVANRWINGFYDAKTEIDQLHSTFREMAQSGRPGEAQALARDNLEMLGLYPATQSIGQQLGQIRKASRAVIDNPTMSSPEKRERLDQLLAVRNALGDRSARAVLERARP